MVDAELDRRSFGRELQNRTDAAGLGCGFAAVTQAWATTLADTPEELRAESVGGEWSLHQTSRHAILATGRWLHGRTERQEHLFHPIGLPFTGSIEIGHDASVFSDPENCDGTREVRTVWATTNAGVEGRSASGAPVADVSSSLRPA